MEDSVVDEELEETFYEIPTCSKSQGSGLFSSLASTATNTTASKLSKAKANLRSLFRNGSDLEVKCSESADAQPEQDSAKNNSVRQKLNNAWLSFKYGNWRLKSGIKFNKDAQLWLLGTFYSRPKDDPDDIALENFLLDYYSRIWLTYRTELPCLPGTSKTTDCGWGCMLRSCQMLLAQALVVLNLGRGWRFREQEEMIQSNLNVSYPDIISLFGDDTSAELGLHRVMEIAQRKYENPVGSWYSPSEALSLFRDALEECSSTCKGGLRMMCVNDGFLVRSEIAAVSDGFKLPVLVVICVRLGTSTINTRYYPHMLNLLSLKNTVGMIGGRPRHSLYFIGWYDKKSLIYLDPHVAHTAIPSALLHSSWQNFHCTDVSKMPLEDIDPSCAFGLLIRSEDEYKTTVRDLKDSQMVDIDDGLGGKLTSSNPLFSVVAERPKNLNVSPKPRNDSFESVGDHGFEEIPFL